MNREGREKPGGLNGRGDIQRMGSRRRVWGGGGKKARRYNQTTGRIPPWGKAKIFCRILLKAEGGRGKMMEGEGESIWV